MDVILRMSVLNKNVRLEPSNMPGEPQKSSYLAPSHLGEVVT